MNKRLILIAARCPLFYKPLAKRFSKGFDVVILNNEGLSQDFTLWSFRQAYDFIALLEGNKKNARAADIADVKYKIKGSPLSERTFLELWAQIVYGDLKELGHEDSQGYF